VYKILIFCGVLLQIANGVFAQEINPRGYFSKDTILIGEHVDFTVVVKYPRGMEVLFPDSSYNFYPFEFLNKSYLNTVSDVTSSSDSVVYKLTTFELDSLQELAVPIFLLVNGDSTEIESNSDNLFIQQVISESVDSLIVKEIIDYQSVSKAFNYPYLFIALGILLIAVIMVAVFFGKEIKRRFKLYRLKRAHLKFLEKFVLLQNEGFKSSKEAENILGFWKTYLERLEGMPYTKLTTREIVTLQENDDFKETLRTMDSNIYGKYKSTDINGLVTKLKDFGIDRFSQKIEEVKHA